MIYKWMTDRLDEDGRLKFDAILGDAKAQAELDRQRGAAVSEADFEVG